MQVRDLSKLQIRSEVLSLLQQIPNLSVLRSKDESGIEDLKLITDNKSVCEILLKEFVKADVDKKEIIAFLLTEMNEVEYIKESLWSYIKNPSFSDELKEIATNILRVLGEVINTDQLVDYLENPDEIIDKETKKLLTAAIANPEAQIDFLDFLFSLKTEEQIQLIESLKEDYPGDELANILVPALQSGQNSNEVQQLIIKILGETRSYTPVRTLKNIFENSKDLKLTSLAKKSLNMLKLSGIDVDNHRKIHERMMLACEGSKPFKAFSTLVDSIGNQGLIFSRISDKDFINMFSVVINDEEGIVDCFGFSNITEAEFDKIIERFATSSTVVEVSPNYAKFILTRAEEINLSKTKNLPYEYTAWKLQMNDVKSEKHESMLSTSKKAVDLDYLYSFSIFNNWFFDEDESEEAKNFLDSFYTYTLKNKDLLETNPDKLFLKLEQLIMENFNEIFAPEKISLYQSRILENCDLYNILGENEIAEELLILAANLKERNISNDKFLKNILKKSVFEMFLRKLNSSKEQKTKSLFKFGQKKIKQSEDKPCGKDLEKILELMKKKWS